MDNFDWLNEEFVKVGSIPKLLDLSKVLDSRAREAALKIVAQMH